MKRKLLFGIAVLTIIITACNNTLSIERKVNPVINSEESNLSDAVCAEGEELVLTVSVEGDEDDYTFQWYSNTKNSNEGGTLIPGATGPSFKPPTDEEGTTYYYVVITDKQNGETTVSNPVKVTVTGGNDNEGDSENEGNSENENEGNNDDEIEIVDYVATDINDLKDWLARQPQNTADTAYVIKLSVDDISDIMAILNESCKYVYLDLSGSTIKEIPDYTFNSGNPDYTGCATLTGITIPDGVTSIGELAFYKGTSLTSVIIPDSVTSIGGNAFRDCSSLINVTIPDSVTSIGNGAFQGCTNLASITIPNSVTSIGQLAFLDCLSLTDITIPYSVTSIRFWTFNSCTSLTSVIIGSGVNSIDVDAFSGCTSLTEITVDAGNSAYTAENGVLYNKSKTTLIKYPAGKTDGAFIIPNSVTSVGRYAFYQCTSLTSVIIGSGVTSIDVDTFTNCYNLAEITVDAGNSAYTAENGVLYNKSKTTLIKYPAGKTDGAFIIPNSVTSVERYAFTRCTSLASVTIPNSVTRIEQQSFWFCTNLTSVTIPNSVTSIGSQAFDFCTNLTSVTFQGTISSANFYDGTSFPGDLRAKFYASNSTNGTPGTYTRAANGSTWTKS